MRRLTTSCSGRVPRYRSDRAAEGEIGLRRVSQHRVADASVEFRLRDGRIHDEIFEDALLAIELVAGEGQRGEDERDGDGGSRDRHDLRGAHR